LARIFSELYLRQGATKYELFHELKHWADFNRLGLEGFEQLGVAGQESSVYEYMKKQNWLTQQEKNNAAFNGARTK
jgi:hypothetical protein